MPRLLHIYEYRFVPPSFNQRRWTRLVPDEAVPLIKVGSSAWPEDFTGPEVRVHPAFIERMAEACSRMHLFYLANGRDDDAYRVACCMRGPDQPVLARVEVL